MMPFRAGPGSVGPKHARSRGIAMVGAGALLLGLVGLPGTAFAAGSTYYVAQSGCSDLNAGTAAGSPLCTIYKATRKAQTGDTISVGAGTYHEQVAAATGVTGLTLLTTAGATVSGSEDLASPTWAPGGSATTWVTTLSPGETPSAVSVGGLVLSKAMAPAVPPNAMSPNTFYANATSLYVDLGSTTAPAATDTVHVARSYGFNVASGTVDGFSVTDTTVAGIYVPNASGAVVKNVNVSASKGYGIEVTGGSGNTVSNANTSNNASIGVLVLDSTGNAVLASTTSGNHNHGVSIQGGSGNRVAGVTSFDNTSPSGTLRIATGIDVNKDKAGAPSANAVIEQNTTYGNADSGIEIYNGASGATVRRNITYHNGDHGIDISGSPDATVVSNTVVGNTNSGINLEGGSTGAAVRNNIAADNDFSGASRTHGDIRVQADSTTGTSLDSDLVFRSSGSGTVIEWGGAGPGDYKTLAAFKAAHPDQEAHGLSGDPKFASGYGLSDGSPALDSADASAPGWLAKDRAGNDPFDQPSVADTGSGAPTYADRGALELTTATQPPVDAKPKAALTVTPATPKVGDPVTLDATASSDDHGVTGYAFDCGNGTTVPPGAAKTTTCTYATAGSFTASVTVTDTASQSDTATQPVTVTAAAPPPSGPPASGPPASGPPASGPPAASPPHAALTVNHRSTRQLMPVRLDASRSTASTGATIVGYRFACGAGDQHGSASARTMVCHYRKVGTYVASVVVTDSAQQTSTATTKVVARKGGSPHAQLTLSAGSVGLGQRLVVTATHSTGSSYWPITRVRISCGSHHRTGHGVHTRLTCRYQRPGWHTIRLTVWNSLGYADTQTRRVWVRRHR